MYRHRPVATCQSMESSGKNPKILIADDDRIIRSAILMTLHHHGFDVLEAADGDMAMAVAANENPDMILLDYIMPKTDGFMTLTQLRRMGYDKPVVMLTASDSQKLAVQCFRAGADDFMTKPMDMDLLPVIVRRALAYDGAKRRATAMDHEVAALRDALRDLFMAVTAGGVCRLCGEEDREHKKDCPVPLTGTVLQRMIV